MGIGSAASTQFGTERIRTVEHTYLLEPESGERIIRKHGQEITPEDAEARQFLAQAAQSFIATVEFYKSEFGGAKSHDDAVKEALQCYERRRGYVEGLSVEEVNWGQLAAVAEVNTDDALDLWRRVREAADDELESGKRGAKVAGYNAEPYALAQYLAIRDSFADQWQPQGGIEWAMIDIVNVLFLA